MLRRIHVIAFGLLVACALQATAEDALSQATQPASRSTTQPTTRPGMSAEEIDALVAALTRDAQAPADRAAHLAEAAGVVDDDPGAKRALLRAAVEHGLQSRDEAGLETTAGALDMLDAWPAERDQCALWRAELYRTWYDTTRDAALRKDLGRRLVDALAAAADVHLERNEWSAAGRDYRQAAELAARLGMPIRAELAQRQKRARRLGIAHGRVESCKKRLGRDRYDTSARLTLVRTLVAELDRPEQAKEYLGRDLSEVWRTYVPLACEPTGELPASVCRELGDWYLKDVSARADELLRDRPLLRARGYYERFLSLHEARDAALIQVRVSLQRVAEQLKALRAELPPEEIDLLAGVQLASDANSAWTRRERGLAVDGERAGALAFAAEVHGGYRVTVAFVWYGGRELSVVVPVGDQAVALRVSADGHAGLERAPGQATPETNPLADGLREGASYQVILTVEPDGDAYRVTAKVNGRPVAAWQGPAAELMLPRSCRLPNSSRLGLATHSSAVVTAACLKPTTGWARPLR